MAERIPTKIKDIKGLSYINHEDLLTVEKAADSMSVEQCYELLMIDPAEMSEYESSVVVAIHKRGRASGVKSAVDKLFAHMATRNGGTSALEYLSKMSGEFAVNVETAKKGTGFNFNVIIPEDK